MGEREAEAEGERERWRLCTRAKREERKVSAHSLSSCSSTSHSQTAKFSKFSPTHCTIAAVHTCNEYSERKRDRERETDERKKISVSRSRFHCPHLSLSLSLSLLRYAHDDALQGAHCLPLQCTAAVAEGPHLSLLSLKNVFNVLPLSFSLFFSRSSVLLLLSQPLRLSALCILLEPWPPSNPLFLIDLLALF